MKKFIFILTLFILSSWPSYAQVLDRTIAVVTLYKSENLSRTEFEKKLDLWVKQTKQEVTDEIKETVLTATINDILISQAAGKAGIIASNQQINEMINQQKQALGTPISDDDLKDFIQTQSGMSWTEYRDQVRNRIVQEQYIYKKYGDQLKDIKDPTKQEILNMYDLYATEFTNPAMVRVDHLFWDTRDDTKGSGVQKKNAEKTFKQIGKSVSKFDDFMERSLDDSSFEGGDMGYIIRDDSTFRILGESFLKSVFSMKKNEVGGVFQTNLGFHIVKITDKRGAKLLQLDDPIFPGENNTVRDRVFALLINKKQQEKFLSLVKNEVKDLRKKAKIRILSKNY